jgi:deoxyadenosine/deoxycytidine kinase
MNSWVNGWEPRRPDLIAIAGTVGVGKQRFARELADDLGWTLSVPEESNPYLASFRRNPARWAFHAQLHFLLQRLEALSSTSSVGGPPLVTVHSIYEDAEIFARNLHEMGLITARDYNTYLGVYRRLCAVVQPPTLLIYLRPTPAMIGDMIIRVGSQRRPPFEPSQLARLCELYEEWTRCFKHCPVLGINVDKDGPVGGAAAMYAAECHALGHVIGADPLVAESTLSMVIHASLAS